MTTRQDSQFLSRVEIVNDKIFRSLEAAATSGSFTVGISLKDEGWSKPGISMRGMDLKIRHSAMYLVKLEVVFLRKIYI